MKLVGFTSILVLMSLSLQAYAREGTISGSVLDKEGKPIANLTVRISRANFDQRFEAPDSNGNYAHTGLPEGEYEVTVTKDGRSFMFTTCVGTAGNRIRIIAVSDGNVVIPDGDIQINESPETSRVNFDLRLLAPYDIEQQQKVTVTGLRVPRKA